MVKFKLQIVLELANLSSSVQITRLKSGLKKESGVLISLYCIILGQTVKIFAINHLTSLNYRS